MNGLVTLSEIRRQPELWRTTLDLVAHRPIGKAPMITGAGTSAYAAAAIAAAWRGARSMAATDLLIDGNSPLKQGDLLISLSRSGNSSESVATIEKIRRENPGVEQLVITCNPNGRMAAMKDVDCILLDPRTNDQSLVMTSSFSNLVLAGLGLSGAGAIFDSSGEIAKRAANAMGELETKAEQISRKKVERVCVLASPPLYALAREASLKILEMTAGRIVPMAETFLGLRHGPMSFLDRETLVVCFMSGDALVGRYERDLLGELRSKKLGRIVAITPVELDSALCDELVPSLASELPDALRTPFDVVFPQLLAYWLTKAIGADPDNPSPNDVITRVVEGVRIYES